MKDTRTIFDLIEENPKFDYEGAKKAGYTDKEIYNHLFKSQSGGIVDYLEIDASWSNKFENLSRDYPIPFWSFIVIITLCISWALILCVWRLVKLVLYQTVYTVVKAVKDAGTIQNNG